MNRVNVIGAGLAGCETAWMLANNGVKVVLYEQKPLKKSAAHSNDLFAELVCSNSLKASRVNSAAGMLKEEMRRLGSICLYAADRCGVPAGGALAVDRERFSEIITDKISAHENIEIIRREVTKIDDGATVIATGPLTEGALAESIAAICGDSLSFYDAAAPIITAQSVDLSQSFSQSRYDKGGDDYINCPMDKVQYELFYNELINAECAVLHSFDKGSVYEGCMPIEALAKRGADAIRYGPLKPVGLTNPRTGHRPWANLQLRRENAGGTLLNLVGFQTNLKFSEQKRVFSLIPALKNAEFVRYGVMHRNTFINSPTLLDSGYKMRGRDNLWFAGQISGVEGYMESASSGIVAALSVLRSLENRAFTAFPQYTMLGALSRYISDESVKKFQPMGAAIGLLPPLDRTIRGKQERYAAIAQRGLDELEGYMKREGLL